MKIAIVANSGWYVYNFRRNLMRTLRAAGHEIFVLAGEDAYVDRLRAEGWDVMAMPFTGAGTNPLEEVKTVAALRSAAKRVRFDAMLSYTPKGNIYTAIATFGLPARLVPNVSGLGRAFVDNGALARLARLLYRFGMRRANCVFFQNSDDQSHFETVGIVRPAQSRLLPGSGVDLDHFKQIALPSTAGSAPRFLMVARLLREKGVREFVDASLLVRAVYPDCKFALLGPPDATSGRGVPREHIDEWVERGLIDYLGVTDDVRQHVAASDCIVLPSYYREGVPRSLLEGAAMGRPLVTTDAPGCRDCVDVNVNGYLVPVRDTHALGQALIRIAGMSDAQRQAMGAASRSKVEREFSEQRVMSAYMDVIGQMAQDKAC